MIVRHLCRRPELNRRYLATLTEETGKVAQSYSRLQAEERDPAPYFLNSRVQKGLRILTRVDYRKVFRERKDGQSLAAPKLQFMTDEALGTAMQKAARKAEIRLQMPPIVKVRSPGGTVISEDPALQGYETSPLVFTDISYGISDRKRLVVVRETDGTLRHATWEERERYVQVYFPVEGREHYRPKMFGGEYLQSLLDRGEYEFVLDRACIQFEPDDGEYQRVTSEVFSHINQTLKFDSIRSTRHFGCLVFHLLWKNDIDNLLLELLGTRKTDEARVLINLYRIIWPKSRTAGEACEDKTDLGWVLHYASRDSKVGDRIERAVQTCREIEEQLRESTKHAENGGKMQKTDPPKDEEAI